MDFLLILASTIDSDCSILSPNAMNFISKIIDLIRNITPIILIIMGVFELGKAAISQKSDEMNKAKTNFVIKVVAGVLVFFVIVFIQWIVQILNTTTSSKAFSCLNDVLNGTYQVSEVGTENKTTTAPTTTTTTMQSCEACLVEHADQIERCKLGLSATAQANYSKGFNICMADSENFESAYADYYDCQNLTPGKCSSELDKILSYAEKYSFTYTGMLSCSHAKPGNNCFNFQDGCSEYAQKTFDDTFSFCKDNICEQQCS